MVAASSHVALAGATPEVHAWLRRYAGLAPAREPIGGAVAKVANATNAANVADVVDVADVAYVGREFRVYPYMQIADAVRFYAALHARWDEAQLAADLASAGLEGGHQVRRLKLVYQRALVLALAVAPGPELLIVENAEEFDEAPARALLQRAVERVPRAIVTFAHAPEAEAAWFDRTLDAQSVLAAESLT